MEHGELKNIFVTAHDVGRITKQFNFDPHHFLDLMAAESDLRYPPFRIKGKSYALVLNENYAYKNFCADYIKNSSHSIKDAEEYKKIIEIWNRNFGEKGSFMEFLNFILREINI